MASRNETKQVLGVAALLVALAVVVCSAMLGWRYLPGVWGEWLGTIVGIISTPFFMEASFLFIGLTIVLVINRNRQKREDAEIVEIEIEDEPQAGASKQDPKA